MVAFLKATLVGDLRYAPYLVPSLGNKREPGLGFVAAELPWLGIAPEDRDCCYGFFARARSLERYRESKNQLTMCCPAQTAETASAAATEACPDGFEGERLLLPGSLRGAARHDPHVPGAVAASGSPSAVRAPTNGGSYGLLLVGLRLGGRVGAAEAKDEALGSGG